LLLDYIVPISIGVEGGIVGLENGVSPGILAYKRSAADKYLGTEDPAELEKMLTSWDAVEEVGKKLHDASEGKCFMFASIGDLFQCLYYQNPRALVRDGKVVADEVLGDIYARIARMRDNGLINNVEQWSPAWNATMATDDSLFYACAPWSPIFVFKLNDPDGVGNWGAIHCPEGTYLYGSSLYGIPKAARNKEAAWAALQWAFQTREGSEAIRDVQNQVTIYKPAAMEKDFYYQEDPFFKGQAWLQMLADEAMNIKPREATVYDVIVDGAIALGNQALSVGATAEEALKVIKDEILRKAPDLS